MRKFYEMRHWQDKKGHLALFGVCSFALLSSIVTPAYASNSTLTGSGISTIGSDAPQRQSVSGTITDAKGNPLIGVVVLIKGTVSSSITNTEGHYTINFNEKNAIVEARLTGYKTAEQVIGKSEMVNIQMVEDALMLEDVVVVAHGTQRKSSVIGAITSVKMSDMKLPVGKLSTSLGGQLAGVVSVQSSGEPGSGADFYIRGIATFGANKAPLVLVDGIERTLDLVDVEDIDSFSILKDASATAVYGVRGANGVMLINTKKGVSGRPSVTLKYEYGFITPMKMVDLVNSSQFADLYNEAIGYNYYSEKALEQYAMPRNAEGRDNNMYPNVNWIDELFEPMANNQRVNASVSGGGKIARYYISGGYYNEGSIFKESNMSEYSSSINYNKINFRANVDVTVTPTTELGIKLANIFETKNEPGGKASDVWTYAYNSSPNAFPTYYTDENDEWLAWAGPKTGLNPYNALVNTGYREVFSNSTQASISLNQTFGEKLEGLSLKVNYAWDAWNHNVVTRSKTVQQYLADGRDEDGKLILGVPEIEGSNTLGYGVERGDWKQNGQSNYLEASLNYQKKIKDVHSIGALFLYNHKVLTYVGVGEDSGKGKYNALPFKNQGVAGRLTYDYDNRYFAEVNVGYNGSENFSPGNRFGFFPAVALGWVISNESFLKSNEVLSLLKLRATHGLVGNDQIGGRRYIYNATVNTGAGGYGGMGEDGTYNPGGIAVGEVANPNVGWEESTKSNVGLEFGFLNNALKVTTDVFHENREGIFMQRAALPNMSGISTTPWVNVGRMSNTGFETNLEYFQTIGEVALSARANYSFSRNTLLDNDEPDWKYKYQNKIGVSYNQHFGLINEGLFESQEDIDSSPRQTFGEVRTGDIKYRDINGDGIIDSSDNIAIGYPELPEVIYGFGATAQWKGISLSVFFQGTANSNIILSGGSMRPFEAGNLLGSNFNSHVYENIWREATPDVNAIYPRVSTSSNSNNNQTSDYWMRNRSYLRLKNAEIGYDLPSSLLEKIGLKKTRVYVQGVNLLTFSEFKLWDPENGGGQGAAYPLSRTINFGISITY